MSFNQPLGQQALPFPLISSTSTLPQFDASIPFTLSERRGSDESEENSDSSRRPSTGGRATDSKDPKLQARKVQNRLAQREFRQRKQAHVKELEARVEFLSSSKDSQIEQIRAALQGVKRENKLLRNLLAGVTGFIGEGLGGVLPKFDMDGQALESLLARDEDDSAMEALRDHKSRKLSDGSNRPWTASSNPFTEDRRSRTAASEYSTPPFSHSPLPNVTLPYPSPVHSSAAFGQNSHQQQNSYLSYPSTERLDGMGIIENHFEAKRLNENYILPHALQPNRLQREFPHEAAIDRLIWSSFRERAILCADQYDIHELMSDLTQGSTVQDTDATDPANWELSESFLIKYHFLVDDGIIHLTNRYRAIRGEKLLSLFEIASMATNQ